MVAQNGYGCGENVQKLPWVSSCGIVFTSPTDAMGWTTHQALVGSCSLMGPLPTSKSLVVVVDYYSQYFRVAVIQSTTTPKVSTALREIFVRLGYPSSLKTDNGPQFVSKGRSSRSSYMSRKLSIEDQHHYGCKPVVRSKDRRGPSKSWIEDAKGSRGGGGTDGAKNCQSLLWHTGQHLKSA